MKALLKKMVLFFTAFSVLCTLVCDIGIIFDEKGEIAATWACEYSDWVKSEYKEYVFEVDGTWSYLYECDGGNRYYRETDYGTYALRLGRLTMYSMETCTTESYNVSVYMDELLVKDAVNAYKFYRVR